MDQETDYRALEREIRASQVSVGPGVACAVCSEMVPERYIFGKIIYHPAGRPHGTV